MQDESIKELNESVKLLRKEFAEFRKNTTSSNQDELLTRQEVARFLKIDLSTLHHWTKSGILTKYGIGKRVYYKKNEINEAIVELQTIES